MALAAVLVGCATKPSQAPASTAPGPALRGEATDPEFRLVISTPKATWAAGETIQVEAALSYVGGAAQATIAGSGGGVIGFSVEEVNGTRRMGPVSDDTCRPFTIGPGQPMTAPYAKSGGFTAEDPNAAFYRQFFADPLFRLPEGAWRVTVHASFSTGADCGGGRQVDLAATVQITVL